ncbi:hypothetical protein DL98DRAFT_532931 [Cadophora sp. DSE1049]|nr:hypothetical protein DL98DRAFT_532931 [Cadophora sp. DSE1049]
MGPGCNSLVADKVAKAVVKASTPTSAFDAPESDLATKSRSRETTIVMIDQTLLDWLAEWRDLIPSIRLQRKRKTKKIVANLKTFTIFDKLHLELKYMIWEDCMDDGQIIYIEYPDVIPRLDHAGRPMVKLTYEHHALLHVCHDSRKVALNRLTPAFQNNFVGTSLQGRICYLNPGLDALYFHSINLASDFFSTSFRTSRIAKQKLDGSMAIKQPATLRCLAVKNTCSRYFDLTQQLFDHCGQPERIVLSRGAGTAHRDEFNVIEAINARNLKIDRNVDVKAFGYSPVVESMTRKGIRTMMNIRKKSNSNRMKSPKPVTPLKDKVIDEPVQDPDPPFSNEDSVHSAEEATPSHDLWGEEYFNSDFNADPFPDLDGFGEQGSDGHSRHRFPSPNNGRSPL